MGGFFSYLRKVLLYPEADDDLPEEGFWLRAIAVLDRLRVPRRYLILRLLGYAVAWVVALAVAGSSLDFARRSFYNPERRDGNEGHTTIDFGGQYLMGRMLLEGHGRELYTRSYQRQVLQAAYPAEDRGDMAGKGDAESLMDWMMGNGDPESAKVYSSCLPPLAAGDPLSAVNLLADGQERWTPDYLTKARSVGGPLYPPVNAFLNAPLALLRPQPAYFTQQVVVLVLTFFAALGFSLISRGNLWWPVVAVILMIFPGFVGALNLGQNAVLTLAILVWGWVLIDRGRPGWGGVVWGLLVFKPVWALAFFLVPLVTRRWRTCLAMALTGAVLAVLTLPFVGVQTWLDWLHVGKEAADLYRTDKNWIFLSRDLLGVPRRYLLNFQLEGSEREPVWYAPDPNGPGVWWHWVFGPSDLPRWVVPGLFGWGLLLGALELTVRLAVLRPRQARATTGPAAAFLLLGAWMTCYHFMYYDVLLAALPLLLLFTEPKRYLEPLFLVIVPLPAPMLDAALAGYHRLRPPHAAPPPPLLRPGYRNVWVVNRIVPNLALFLLATFWIFPSFGWGGYFGTPWDTYTLMAIWLWCGVLWLWQKEPPRQQAPAAEPPVPLALPAELVQLRPDVGSPH